MGPFDSGKLCVLHDLLHEIHKRQEKLVLISYHTKTLDVLEGWLDHLNFTHCRLDGTTASNARNTIVEDFNNPDKDLFVFLLSAKAGGVGLNLIGASRLVLFDNDWNPASDLQVIVNFTFTHHIVKYLTPITVNRPCHAYGEMDRRRKCLFIA